jgi:dihydropteroate synthase
MLPSTTPPPFEMDGRTLDFSVPRIMGVINATPDSFYGGSRVDQAKQAAATALKMVDEGADLLDIGGQSSRPGAKTVGTRAECERILPVIEEIRAVLPHHPLSVDTYHSVVASRALDAGADMVNDIGAALMDPQMEDLMAERNVPYILMHMQGTPESMQNRPEYGSVTAEVSEFLEHRLLALREKGVSQIGVDPGFGFGKSVEHNYQLLDTLGQLGELGVPILAGLSRKSMIYKVLESSPEQALNGTSVLHAWALDRGAHILRVHDVAEAAECVKLHCALSMSRLNNTDD